MHAEHWNERLSDYLDGHLADADRAACARHLASCAPCRGLLAELERVKATARALPADPPAHDLWAGIAARIAAAPARDEAAAGAPATPAPVLRLDTRPRWWQRRFTFALPQVAAAALILVVVAGGATWLALRGRVTVPVAGRETTPAGSVPVPGAVDAVIASVDPRYDRTIAELQGVLAHERARLDTSTVRILEQNLALIDRAVAEASRAVEKDPSNAYLRSHLAATMKRKVELLRRATVIPGAQG